MGQPLSTGGKFQATFGFGDFRASPDFVPFIFLHHEHDAEGFGPVAKTASKFVVG